MPDLAKIDTSHADRGTAERFAIMAIVLLLVAVQITYVAKHTETFATILSSAVFGIVAP